MTMRKRRGRLLSRPEQELLRCSRKFAKRRPARGGESALHSWLASCCAACGFPEIKAVQAAAPRLLKLFAAVGAGACGWGDGGGACGAGVVGVGACTPAVAHGCAAATDVKPRLLCGVAGCIDGPPHIGVRVATEQKVGFSRLRRARTESGSAQPR